MNVSNSNFYYVIPAVLGGNPVAFCRSLQLNDARFPPKAAGMTAFFTAAGNP